MENKEVEDALFYMSEKARREPYTDPELIVNYHRGIGEYIELLEQQLKAKDKALNKAIKSRELIDDCPPEYDGCLLDDSTYDGEQYACDFCWKKWCENGKEWAEDGTD